MRQGRDTLEILFIDKLAERFQRYKLARVRNGQRRSGERPLYDGVTQQGKGGRECLLLLIERGD